MDELFNQAKLRLLMSYPFFASLLFRLKCDWDEEAETAWTDGVSLGINPKFFEGLSIPERLFILAHEVGHVMLLHHTRRGVRDPKIWNVACDFALNLLLSDCGLTLPKGCMYDQTYRGMSSEAIYDLIKGIPDDGSKGMGEVRDFPGDSQDIQEEEGKQKASMIQANELAKIAGKGSLAIDQIIKDLIAPKISWKDELRQILTEKIRDDYSWSKPNKRYLGTGFYLPTLENETYGLIGLFWDSSGSTNRFREEFASEINEIKHSLNAPVWVVYADTKVNHSHFVEPDEDLIIESRGGGGTDFIPPFEWIEQNDIEPKLCIYFTDGECNSFPPEPDYEVIWAKCGSYPFNPPFGNVINVN